MTQGQPAGRKRQALRPQPAVEKDSSAGRQRGHPILALQRSVGNAGLARVLRRSPHVAVQRAAYLKAADLAGESSDENHVRWITLALANAAAGGGAPGQSQIGGSGQGGEAAGDIHAWAHRLGLTEWEQ